jgi:hypothetical protein
MDCPQAGFLIRRPIDWGGDLEKAGTPEWKVSSEFDQSAKQNKMKNMSTEPITDEYVATTGEYMLLFRGQDWDRKLSPEELQRSMSKWTAWYNQLAHQGKIKSAHPLTQGGRVISQKKGQPIADGPFAESKEAIGGYFLLQQSSLEEAVEIAKKCPLLEHGVTVEVRAVAEQCSHLQRVNQELAHATT